MKSIKKALAILFAVVMMLSMATTVLADGSTGSLTINGTTAGKTYDLYKILDLNYQGDNVSYTIASGWVDFFIGAGAPGAQYMLTAQPAGGSLNQLTHGSQTYYINITSSNVAAFAQAAFAWCATKPADQTELASGTSLTFTNLPLGYYLVYPQGATEIEGSNASICSLTSTNPSATVNVKATYPTIEKVVDDPSANIGQTVTFTISGKVPDTTGYTYYKFEVKDTMTAGLTFNDTVDELTVKFGTTTITVPETGKVTYAIANNGFTLTFDMTKYQNYKGQDITITYKAVVNENAVSQLTQNSATVTYSNDPEHTESTETSTTETASVYTNKIVIDKYDGASSAKLPGAKFVLVKNEGGTEKFYKLTPANGANPATVTWVTSLSDATVVETNASGAASFIGIEDGTYALRETVAPSGYNLLASDVPVTVAHATEEGQAVGATVTAPIANNAGVLLPATGGEGTTLLIVLGSVLFMATMIVLVTKKRMYNEGC